MHCLRSWWWLCDHFLWWLECRVESLHLWSMRDQGSNIAWLEKEKKKVKKPFPTVNNVFALRRPTFTLTWICISFHWQNRYEFQRSKPFSKLHLLYLNPLSKQSFPNYSQNIRRSSLQISRSILVSQTKQVLLHSFCQRSTPSETWH